MGRHGRSRQASKPLRPAFSIIQSVRQAANGNGHGPAPGPELTHGHGHGHGHQIDFAPAGHRVRVLLAMLLVPCALASLIGVLLLYPFDATPPESVATTQPVNAVVRAITPADCALSGPGQSEGNSKGCLALSLLMSDGPGAGRGIVSVVPVEPTSPRYSVGDRVVLTYAGGDPTAADSYVVSDFQRDTPLWVLAVLFAGAVLLLGRWRGFTALLALGISFTVLLVFVLPAILHGRNPLAVAVAGSCLIMFAVLYLSHGVSARTSTAVLGTMVSLGVIGVLGAIFTSAARLTGLDEDTRDLISSLGADSAIDPRGLLLAGFVIGALGVLDDVTVTQTSAVWELRRANAQLSARALFTSAMRIGRDHVSSAVNTLVLAYAGAALPLLLLFTLAGRGIGQTLSTQTVATELVRTLVGSIGLIASVPITTGVAALVASREEPAPADS